ncbi:tubulin nucleotide-binding domain-like protein [Marasmius fiardii PR-910]|nr:tubulin nucleotide-binding domain-like protein [Marasmius fiardii PR-910]
MMREIIYIQAGSLANHISTHFWNAQEAYFTYSEQENDGEEPLIEHDVSFREGLDRRGNTTYTPRALIFDRKANFGSLARNGILNNDDDENIPAPWNGDVTEYKQEAIPQSRYQSQLQDEFDFDQASSVAVPSQDVRYWSDFNRVYYHPRSMQVLPDIPDWQGTEGSWVHGQETFTRFAEETDVMETSVRSFLEECDYFQGLQVINDTSSFGSFTYSLLSTFRDELSKTSPVVIPLVTDAVLKNTAEPATSRKILNEAFYLRGLKTDLPSSTTVFPIQVPCVPRWRSPLLAIDGSRYHTSALLSAHIENATISLRSKLNRETIPIFSSSLNPLGLHNFSQLSGVLGMSLSPPDDLDAVIHNQQLSFWCGREQHSAPTPSTYFSRRDVTRALSFASSTSLRGGSHDGYLTGGSIKINNTTRSPTRLPSYPIPTSFPNILVDNKEPRIPESGGEVVANHNISDARVGKYSDVDVGDKGGVEPLGIFSSLVVSPTIGSIFADYARFVSKCVQDRRGEGADDRDGLDELKEVVNDLWTIHDGYVDLGERPNDDGDVLDEDEE